MTPDDANARPTLHLVLAEAAVELVPEAIAGHPSVSKVAKQRNRKPTQVLLDDTVHHAAMKQGAQKGRFPDLDRRGRPDILHLALQVAMDHRLNHDRRLRVWVHTRDDDRITIAPHTRLQRAQYRFYGLLESLYRNGAVPPEADEPLLEIVPGFSLTDAIAATKASHVYLLDMDGDDAAAKDALEASFRVTQADGPTDVCLVIGAFPTGPFQSDLAKLDADERVQVHRIALGKEPLTAWTVVGECLTRWMLRGA